MPVAESIDQDVLLRTIDRERQSRLMSERLLEDKSRALYLSKEKVQEQYESLKQTQGQLLHSEKMASVGQLAAGVAHEINNPIGFVTSNV
jgi:two-component system, NtrC family, sensor kinase